MMMLQKKYTAQRLEAACKRALQGTLVNYTMYTMIKNILEKGLDKQIHPFDNENNMSNHGNIPGKDHYQKSSSKIKKQNNEHNRNIATNAAAATTGHAPCLPLTTGISFHLTFYFL
ncbi:MAG: Integrase catalytic region [Ferruginibacter sp.]|nr:Integrase catalytic region [Ferruginibacter sp.]